MIAYHYPPCRGSSGVQRTLHFTRQLPVHGWDPIVLTATPCAYPERSTDQLADIPSGTLVRRVFALDSAKHLAIKGRYLSWTGLPDRWISWILSAIPTGLHMIRKYRPAVLWSTYPIASALWIGYALHRLSGQPWIVDVRDPLTEDDSRTGKRYPAEPSLWRARRAIEQRAMVHSTRTVLVTSGARRLYAERYPTMSEAHWVVIPNGYPEESFQSVERTLTRPERNGQPFNLLHSGTLYPTADRDPTAFFEALGRLRANGRIGPRQVRVTLRASGYDDYYRQSIQQQGLEDMVRLAPPIPYRDALAEMITADGLLLFQGYTSNPAVPAKLYEYLRAKRPIFALVDGDGDTAAILRTAKTGVLVPLESGDRIAEALPLFLDSVRNRTAAIADDAVVKGFARESRTRELAALLDQVTLEHGSNTGRTL
jgi:hypothetical protein